MASVNKVILIGNVGRDPELKYMANGDAVANVSIATTETWKDKATGEKKEKTEWHRLVFFRRLAEIVGEYVQKGKAIYVEGRLQTRQYEKEGVTHYSTEIVVDEMKLLGGKRDSEDGGGTPPPVNRSARQPAAKQESKQDDFDDDIPF